MKKIAKIMNEFYINKVKNIQKRLPVSLSDPLLMLKQNMESSTSVFTLETVSPDHVKRIICQLRNSKSTGTDNIDTYIIKLVKEEIIMEAKVIRNIF